ECEALLRFFMKKLNKYIFSVSVALFFILSVFIILQAINDSYNKVNHCYMLMYGRTEEKEEFKCW
ncbi:hypothetical protein, partial [Globicatella sp. HMSC072A10]|uniref:hypothetical protein n=1 Tax=Globicatella sp. HMSC072A10 TaxID=1739315 RepID=UPI001AEF7FEA